MSQRLRELVAGGMELREALRVTTTTDCSVEPSRTKQSFAEEVEINRIVERFVRTGFLPPVDELGGVQPRFGDFSSEMDFLDAMQRVKDAEGSFMALPARVRDRFNNDPAELLEFLSRKENREEAVELGLVEDKRGPGARTERSRREDVREGEIRAAEARGRSQGAPVKAQ